MADLTMRELEGRIDRLETKVGRVDTKLDQMDREISEAFVEQRTLVLESADALRRDLTQAMDLGLRGVHGELAGVHGEIESLKSTTTSRFNSLERRLDASTEAQAVVNQRLLDRLDGQAVVSKEILARLGA